MVSRISHWMVSRIFLVVSKLNVSKYYCDEIISFQNTLDNRFIVFKKHNNIYLVSKLILCLIKDFVFYLTLIIYFFLESSYTNMTFSRKTFLKINMLPGYFFTYFSNLTVHITRNLET